MKSMRTLTGLLVCSLAAFAQYKSEPGGAPPAEVAPAIVQAMQKAGTKITNNGAAYCEIWFRTDKPSGPKATEENITLQLPQGALIGVIRFTGSGSDRRGQSIKAGVYTLRYGIMPVNGDHQGAAPQRDFLLMTPAAEDKDLNATPNFEALVAMSRKASGTPHPAVLSVWKPDVPTPGFSKQNETDWVLQIKFDETPIAIILIGVASS